MQSWKLGVMPALHGEAEQDGPIKENEPVGEQKY